jgi:hypothetical protein
VRCFACPGPYHPATGHLFAPGVAYCGPCYRHFIGWYKAHTRRRWGGADFYVEAATSIRARATVTA